MRLLITLLLCRLGSQPWVLFSKSAVTLKRKASNAVLSRLVFNFFWILNVSHLQTLTILVALPLLWKIFLIHFFPVFLIVTRGRVGVKQTRRPRQSGTHPQNLPNLIFTHLISLAFSLSPCETFYFDTSSPKISLLLLPPCVRQNEIS